MAAVKREMLRGQGLIRLGRSVPKVISIVTRGFSGGVAAREVGLIKARKI